METQPSTASPIYKIGILGASGYTGADLARLAVAHPNIEITALAANTHAGKKMAEVYPHLKFYDLPDLVDANSLKWDELDAVFCGLPHATSQKIIKEVASDYPDLKIIDMSADFRLRDIDLYAQWYENVHVAPDLQKKAVYGLSEHNRDDLKDASLIACPGCFPTAALLSLIPLIKEGHISDQDLIINALTGLTGAGRSLKQNILFSEAGEGASIYGIASHRHAPEIEQELAKAANISSLTVNFTPHLVPMSRGELLTSYVRLQSGVHIDDLRQQLHDAYDAEPFVHVLDPGVMPGTQMVRGSNHCVVNVFEDRIEGRAIIVAALDNLVKGSSGQALQNFNIAFGLEETLGLRQAPLFP